MMLDLVNVAGVLLHQHLNRVEKHEATLMSMLAVCAVWDPKEQKGKQKQFMFLNLEKKRTNNLI